MNANKNAVANSTSGYCHDIFSPQARHLARWIAKLTNGTSSYHESVCAHLGHRERSNTIEPRLGLRPRWTALCKESLCSSTKREPPSARRQITTFKKLPMISPNTNTRTISISTAYQKKNGTTISYSGFASYFERNYASVQSAITHG